MGCGASYDNPGPMAEDITQLPRPSQEEMRIHREIDNMDFWSDADTAEEPSSISASLSLKARVLVARVSHGINDDAEQFDIEVRASVPQFVPEDFDFVRDWQVDCRDTLGADLPIPIEEGVIAARPQDGEAGSGSSGRRHQNTARTEAATVSRQRSAAPQYMATQSPNASTGGTNTTGSARFDSSAGNADVSVLMASNASLAEAAPPTRTASHANGVQQQQLQQMLPLHPVTDSAHKYILSPMTESTALGPADSEMMPSPTSAGSATVPMLTMPEDEKRRTNRRDVTMNLHIDAPAEHAPLPGEVAA
jgi:hypothetical protein